MKWINRFIVLVCFLLLTGCSERELTFDRVYPDTSHLDELRENIQLEIKEEMRYYGSIGTMMSGSGPTIFALFDDMQKAQKTFEKMKEKYKDVYITRTI